ncbi:hypothetical protein HPP92_020856 [Vanilla planifolia]|uniref:Chalcone-flavonone isomerase family protein n=1 Tax=Vanilla planifolia TaxID=51239 RepID=A0A835PXU2_VANPL|nr:hypothetical protein HPP92_020856 [Vanilla planifolia]
MAATGVQSVVEGFRTQATADPEAVMPVVRELLVEGVAFPAEAIPPGSSKRLFLGGAGARGIEIGGSFKVVTAIGVYLEKTAVQALGGQWKGKLPAELAGSADFFHQIVTGRFEKLTRVSMILPLTGKQYSEKVASNCVAAWKAAEAYTNEEDEAIKNFLEAFETMNFRPGSSIFFTHSPQGSFTIGFSEDGAVPKAAVVVIENEKLSNAILESIIGEKGVSPAAKQSLAHRMSGLFLCMGVKEIISEAN